MKKITLLALSLSLGANLMAQLPANNFATYSFNGGSLAETNGGTTFTGTATAVTDRHGDNNAIDPASVMNGVNLGATNINNSTLSFWMRSSSTNNERIIQMYGTNGAGYRVEIHGNLLGFTGKAETSSSFLENQASDSLNLNDSTWHHVAIRTSAINSGQAIEMEMFIDGAPTTSTATVDPAGTGNITNFLKNATLVINPYSGDEYTGEIDDVILYKSALSDAEILQLYNYAVPTPRFYVDKDATGNNDGTSWADAYTDLRDGFLNTTPGAEVWVAEGTYTRDPSTPRNGSFGWTTDGVKAYGGFNGTETMLSERDWRNNPTIISADIGTAGDSTDNAYTAFIGALGSSGAAISYGLADGFIIEGGYALESGNGSDARGAGFFMGPYVKEMELKNCIFRNNTAFYGGALYASSETVGATLNIENCIFENNVGTNGSAIFIQSHGTHFDVNINNSLVTQNRSEDIGNQNGLNSALYFFKQHHYNLNVKVNNTTIANNSNTTASSYEGTVMLFHNEFSNGSSSLEMNNSIIWGNSGDNHAIVKNNTGVDFSSVVLNNTLIEQGIHSGVGNLTLTDTLSANPLFTDFSNGDFTLQSNSPAIDAGNNSFIPTGITTDLAGNNRIYNTTVDLGCYEYSGTSGGGGTNSIEENTISMTVFPNPTSGKVEIKSDVEISSVEIFSTSGQKVASFETKAFDISALQSGVYFVKVLSDGGSFTTRIIRE